MSADERKITESKASRCHGIRDERKKKEGGGIQKEQGKFHHQSLRR